MILYKVVLNLEYLAEMLQRDHWNKNIVHYYPAVLFIRLQKIVQTSKTVDGILIKAKATLQLLPVVLFIMHYKVFLISESVNEIP